MPSLQRKDKKSVKLLETIYSYFIYNDDSKDKEYTDSLFHELLPVHFANNELDEDLCLYLVRKSHASNKMTFINRKKMFDFSLQHN